MIFTSEDGKKYELVHDDKDDFLPDRRLIIRPIIEPKKWEVDWLYEGIGCHEIVGVSVDFGKLPEARAELIKDAVESLMWRILSDSGTSDLPSAIDKARDALKEEL